MKNFSETRSITFVIYSEIKKTCILSFCAFDFSDYSDETPSFLGTLVKENEDYTLKLYLSNGEILTSETRGNGIWLTCGTHSLKSNKGKNDENGSYVMKQLRKYNITKISVNGHEFTTPNFRSAATIDAMCKKLITKTGDQGQYGGSTSVSSSKTTSSSTPPALLPLTIDGRTSGYHVNVPGKKKDYVYAVKTRNGQYVKDTKLEDFTVTSDFYWARIKRKTESAFQVDLDENTSGSPRTATITVKADGVATTMTITQASLASKINRVWVEHNKRQGLIKGMKIHVSFETFNMRGMQGQINACFFFANGTKLMDYNGYYRAIDGQVCTYQNFVPPYDATTYNDFTLFIPYSELHVQGAADCKFNVVVHIGGQMITSDYVSFSLY